MKISLAPIRRPVTLEEWKRFPDKLIRQRFRRGSDQSDVDERCITRFACMLTPKLERKLAAAAKRLGLSEAAIVRDLIEKGCP